MMKKSIFRDLLILIVITAISACVRDSFLYYGGEDTLNDSFPVDSIEKGHTWILTTTCSSFITGNAMGANKVQVLSGNPFTESGVEILAEASTSSQVSLQMRYVVPEIQKQVYVAALDKDGNYLRLVSASPGQETIKFDGAEPEGTPNDTRLQRIFYCFEADFPNVGDWDYNDIVLSVRKEVKADNPNVVALHVTLHAVGYPTQIAAAIRLVGVNYDEVTITQSDSANFIREPDRKRSLIRQKDVQLKALGGDAVINLFDDAHLAMFSSSSVDGSVYRRYFNTMEDKSNPNSGNQQPATATYYIDLGSEYQARNFTLAALDPFIVVQYGQTGSNFWEIHTRPYKLAEVLYNYYQGGEVNYNNGFSWALAIPYADFRYPLEGYPIGMRKNTIVSGAYQTRGHAFGEWMLSRERAKDWYLYPAEGAVYEK